MWACKVHPDCKREFPLRHCNINNDFFFSPLQIWRAVKVTRSRKLVTWKKKCSSKAQILARCQACQGEPHLEKCVSIVAAMKSTSFWHFYLDGATVKNAQHCSQDALCSTDSIAHILTALANIEAQLKTSQNDCFAVCFVATYSLITSCTIINGGMK